MDAPSCAKWSYAERKRDQCGAGASTGVSWTSCARPLLGTALSRPNSAPRAPARVSATVLPVDHQSDHQPAAANRTYVARNLSESCHSARAARSGVRGHRGACSIESSAAAHQLAGILPGHHLPSPGACAAAPARLAVSEQFDSVHSRTAGLATDLPQPNRSRATDAYRTAVVARRPWDAHQRDGLHCVDERDPASTVARW